MPATARFRGVLARRSRGNPGVTLPAWSVYALGGWFLVLALAVPWAVRWQGFLRAPLPAVESQGPQVIRPVLLRLPGGTFQMGVDDDEKLVRWVELSSFELCQTEVTRAQWRTVMNRGSDFCTGDCGNKPVTDVSWFDAIEYLNRLTGLEGGMTSCYERRGDKVTWKRECTGFRLPTEAEWEYGARAGSRTAYSVDDSESELGKYAWLGENSDGQVHEVATREPNMWQLYDMHGNVWEWVWDWWDWKAPYRPASNNRPERDPRGPEDEDPSIEEWGGEDTRVIRGGGFVDEARLQRSARRLGFRPAYWGGLVGFRCARSVPPASSPQVLTH